MEIVVYDEIEKFRQYSNPEFAYPYEKRKNNLVEINYGLDIKDYVYQFTSDVMNMRLS